MCQLVPRHPVEAFVVLISVVVRAAVIGVQVGAIHCSESFTSAFQSVRGVGQLNG